MDLHRVDLNLLVSLEALLAECSVTRAAERLSVGQPAMSGALRRLRKLFDDPLLVRRGAGLEPTALAQSLMGPVSEATAAVRAVLSVGGTFDPSVDEASFTVVASDYAGLVLLPALVREITLAAPGVRVTVRPVSAGFTGELRRGEVDLVVVPRELMPERHGLDGEELFRDRYVCAVAADNPDVGDVLTLDQLAGHPHVAGGGGRMPALGQRHLPLPGAPPRFEVSTQTSLLTPFLLRGTPLLAVLPEMLARQLAAAAGIRVVEPPVPLGTLTETLYWAPGRSEDAAHRWLRARFVAVAVAVARSAGAISG